MRITLEEKLKIHSNTWRQRSGSVPVIPGFVMEIFYRKSAFPGLAPMGQFTGAGLKVRAVSKIDGLLP
jgi:hypothetical protein